MSAIRLSTFSVCIGVFALLTLSGPPVAAQDTIYSGAACEPHWGGRESSPMLRDAIDYDDGIIEADSSVDVR